MNRRNWIATAVGAVAGAMGWKPKTSKAKEREIVRFCQECNPSLTYVITNCTMTIYRANGELAYSSPIDMAGTGGFESQEGRQA